MTTSTNASPRVPRQSALSDDMDYEDKHMFPPSNRSHLGSPLFSRKSTSSVASSVENSPAAPANAKSYPHSPMQSRRSEPELLASPRSRADTNEYPRYESRKRMSADFSDDTMSVGSIGGESPKSDRGSWRLHSAVSGPFLTGPLAKDFQTEHLKTPRGKARDDMNFDHSGLLFPLAPVLDTIPDTPRGGFYQQQTQSFTDISQFENSSEPMDGFQLDSAGGYASHDAARPVTAFNATRRSTSQAYNNSQFFGSSAVQYDASSSSQQQHFADGSVAYSASQQSSSAIVATQASSNGHGPSYADVVVRNGSSSSQEQSLVAASASESLESLSQGMADSMAQILAKTQSGRTYGEVQLTTLVQKIHMHMTVMGRTSAAIREDYNRIKAKLEQTITDKKVLEATNYHLQQLVQQYEVERQYFHQYVLHSLQSQSSLIYESMGTLSQNVVQSKHTIEELSARLSRELSNFQGSGRSDSQLKEILEEIKRAVDASALASAQLQQQQQQHSDAPLQQPQHAPARSPVRSPSAADAKQLEPAEPAKASGFKLVPVLLAVLLWVATLSGVYLTAKSAALSELQTQTQQPSAPMSMLATDLDRIVDQIAQKLETAVQASEVRKLVYTELEQNPQLVDTVVIEPTVAMQDATSDKADDAVARPVAPATKDPVPRSSDDKAPKQDATPRTESVHDTVKTPVEVAKPDVSAEAVVAPFFDASSDAAEPPAPTTTAVDATTTKKEEPAPPVEPFAISDAAIAEMLRLNGFPTGVPPLDTAASASADVVAPPTIDVLSPPTVDASAAPATESVAKTDEASDVASSVTDSTPATSASIELNVVAPEAPKTDSSLNEDASAGDVVEITIASALHPEVIAPTESTTASANATAAEPAQRIVDSIALDALDSVVVPPVESITPSKTEPVDALPVEDASTPSTDVIATDAIESPVANGDDPTRETSVTKELADHSSSDDLHGDSVIPESAAAVNDIEAVEAVVIASVENASAAKPATAAVSHVEPIATDADDDDASASSVLDKLTASAPFTGLSMALRSLAHRLVESVDVSSLSTSGTDELAAPEALSVVNEIARHVDEPTAEAADAIAKEALAEEAKIVEDVAPVESVDDVVDVVAEEPPAAIDASVESTSEVVERALESSDDDEVATSSPASNALDANADVVTVEVTAGGDVAAPTDKESSEEDAVASGDGMDALRSFFSTLESQVAELAAQGEQAAIAAPEDTTEETKKSKPSDDSAPDTAEASISESSDAPDAVETAHDAVESVAPTLVAASDNDDLVQTTTQASAADDASDKSPVDALVTDSPSVDNVEEPMPAAPVEDATVVPAVDPADAPVANAPDAAASVSADKAQDAPAVDASTVIMRSSLEINTDAATLATGASTESVAIDAVDGASSSEQVKVEVTDAPDATRRLSSVDAIPESPATDDAATVVVPSAAEPTKSETKSEAKSDATSDEAAADEASADDITSSSESVDVAELKRADESSATSDAAKDPQAPATASVADKPADAVDVDASADSTTESAPEPTQDSDSEGTSAPTDSIAVVSGTERKLEAEADGAVAKTTDALKAPESVVDATADAGHAVQSGAAGSVHDDVSTSAATSESSYELLPSSEVDSAAPIAESTPAIELEHSASLKSATDSVKDAPDASPADVATTLASDASVPKMLDDAITLAPPSDAKEDASTPVDAAAVAADEDDAPAAKLATETSVAPVAASDAKRATQEAADRDL